MVVAVAAVLAVVVGGPFVYIHFIEGKAPAPLGLPTQPSGTTTATGAPATVDGTWNVASGSVVGYRIKEILFGQSATAVGRTGAITGSITIRGGEVTAARFSVDMTTVTSDQSQRDHQFQGRIMDTTDFPTATFALTRPIRLGGVPTVGATVTVSATGNLTMHGTTRTVTFPLQARRGADTTAVSGAIPIVFADYGIDNPSGGPATTSDHGTLEFLLNFSHA